MKIGLIGVSVRPAVEALQADPRVALAVDLFADHDTQLALPGRCHAVAGWETIFDWPAGHPQPPTLSRESLAWLPLGGLDLRPDVLSALESNGGSVLGCPRETLRFCKSPERWSAALQSAGFAIPPYHLGLRTPPGVWYLKQRWPSPSLGEPSADWFWQQGCRGTLASALYLAQGGQVECIGCTRLFVTPDLRYLGNLATHTWPGPQPLEVLERLGTCLAERATFVGLFGVDFFWTDQVWPIEINPRPTASVEVLERLHARPLYRPHLTACWAEQPFPAATHMVDPAAPQTLALSAPWPTASTPATARIVAKRIVYRPPTSLTIGQAEFDWLIGHRDFQPQRISVDGIPRWCLFRIADIPQVGTVIPPWEPLCTLIVEADDWEGHGGDHAIQLWEAAPQLLPSHFRNERCPRS